MYTIVYSKQIVLHYDYIASYILHYIQQFNIYLHINVDNNIAVQRAREQLESFVEATPFETDDQQLQRLTITIEYYAMIYYDIIIMRSISVYIKILQKFNFNFSIPYFTLYQIITYIYYDIFYLLIYINYTIMYVIIFTYYKFLFYIYIYMYIYI